MIEALYNLSNYIEPSDRNIDGIELDPIEAKHLICLDFDNGFQYKGVSYEQVDTTTQKKYLFKNAPSSNPPTYTPTLSLNRKEPRKTLDNLVRILEKLREALGKNTSGYQNIGSIIARISQNYQTVFSQNYQTVLNDISQKIKNISNESIFLTIKIDGKYIGEIDYFIEAFKKVYFESNKRFNESKGRSRCCICGQEKDVAGDISPYTFYTIYNRAYIVGGMRKEISWKNFPLCMDCKVKLDNARIFVEKNLKFNFTSFLSYYLIPEFLVKDKNKVNSIIRNIMLQQKQLFFYRYWIWLLKSIIRNIKSIIRNIMLQQKQYDIETNFTGDQRGIERLLNEDDILVVNLLFLKEQESRETIELLIQGIYPSRIKEIFDKRDLVNSQIKKYVLFPNGDEYDEEVSRYMKSLNITTDNLVRFFGKSKDDFPFKNEFYRLIENLFKGIKYDERALLKIFMIFLKNMFIEDEGMNNFRFYVLSSYFSYVFIKLCTEGGNFMLNFEDLDKFLSSLRGLGDNDLKKAIFLTGVLAQRVLDYQEKERGSKPFLSKLANLNLTEKKVKRIFTQVKEKLESYDEFKPADEIIYKKASELFSKSSDSWGLSFDEISYYFALGLGMKEKVYSIIFEFLKNRKED